MASLNMQRASDLLLGVSIFGEPIKTKIIDRAHSAMEELWRLGVAPGEPLWHPHKEDRYEILNYTEYLKAFGRVDSTLMEIVRLAEVGELQALPSFDSCRNMNPMLTNQNSGQGLQIEASRDMALFNMNPVNIVEILIDNQWSMAFHNIVSRATVLGSFSDGVEGTYDGKLHVMSAEFHLPSPVIPTRECSFARYCKKLPYDRWVVVDVSLEDFFPSPTNNLRKRPSGCLIIPKEKEPTQVIWVEHVEADHSQLNNLFKPLVTSGLAFGATRWIASMIRHFETSVSLKATMLAADAGVLIPQTGRTSFLKLADRMKRKFCANLSATTSNPWMRLAPSPNSIDVRVMIDNNMNGATNNPLGTSVVFSTTIWFNVSPNRLFNFLRHEKSRNEWDILSKTLFIQEFASMVTGQHPENRVSLLRASNSKDKTEIFYLQESYATSSASYVIYAPLEESALAYLAKGSNQENVIAYPSGFAIIPGGLHRNGDPSNGNESLLTISFHLLDKAITNVAVIPPESVKTIYGIITETVTAIKDALLYHSRHNNWAQDELKNGSTTKNFSV
ncbi:homeodomain GLABROUS [Trifolium repens]|nr:homeodomain GLABROUS [Trifolium repens]